MHLACFTAEVVGQYIFNSTGLVEDIRALTTKKIQTAALSCGVSREISSQMCHSLRLLSASSSSSVALVTSPLGRRAVSDCMLERVVAMAPVAVAPVAVAPMACSCERCCC